ncbi:MAG: hypothetical protein OYI31_08710 [Chloroflexota bacterium]|nr:hypothetical protein [Chloroflexota bacterium]MDE3268512.1 hypothetical protein [Chloroflexota bacterium]
MTILRALCGLTLGLLVFAGLLYLLVVVNIVQRLDDPELYRASFTETDAYNRIYDEVLVDAAVQDQTLDLLGGVGLETQEAIEVLRDVIPPAYLQEQVEANIDRFTGFLSHDLERLNLYLELKEPLDRVEAVVLDKAEQVITELEVEEPPTATTECTEDSLQSLAGDLANEFSGLSAGQLPESVPSLETLDQDCRRQEFDKWIDQVANSPQLDSQTARIIEDQKDDLRESFIEGDTRAFLEKAAAPLVSPVIDDSLEEIRQDLQLSDRLDLLAKLAEGSDDLTREDIDEQAEFLRDTVSTASGTGRMVALLVIIVGSLLLAAVYIPNPKGMLRWPGLTLLIGGGVCLVVGFVLNSVIPGRVGDAVTDFSSGTPTALIGLAGDLVESFARQFTAGFIPGAATVLVVGAVLFGASFFADRLWSIVRGAPIDRGMP